MKRLAAALAVFGFLAAGPAQSAEPGFYFGIGGGPSFLKKSSIDSDGVPSSINLDADSSVGFMVSGVAGFQFRNGIAVEGEVGYRRAALDSLDVSGTIATTFGTFTGSGSIPLSGSFDSLSFMANGRYGYQNETILTPFVLAGVGIARVGINNARSGGLAIADDTDWVFAYQGGAGVGIEITPMISAEVSYRYFATLDPSFTDAAGVGFDAEYRTHNVLFTLKFTLPYGTK